MTRSSALPSNNLRSGIARFLPHWIPTMFVGGFLAVIGVNGTLIFFAQDTFSGLDTASPYERGLDYNSTLAAEAAQERLGWQYQAAISGESGDVRTLRISMADRDGQPLTDLTLDAYLIRPSNVGLDISVTPQPIGDGSYVASFALPAPGQWALHVVAHRGETVWQHSERVFLK